MTVKPQPGSGLCAGSCSTHRIRRRALLWRGGSSSCGQGVLRTDLSIQESSGRAAVQGYQSTLGDLERASLLAKQAVGVLEDGVTATSKLFNTLAEAITEADRQ